MAQSRRDNRSVVEYRRLEDRAEAGARHVTTTDCARSAWLRTGIDLPGEATGILRKPASWREIDLANHGFGQGVGVTPIQLAVAYAAIANGGNLVRPYVVKAAYDATGRPMLTHTPEGSIASSRPRSRTP